MDVETARSLRELLASRLVGALGTLHFGEPAVSMVPFVLPAGDSRLYIHVSALATHTADMQAHARVSLLVMAEPGSDTSPLALPRVSLLADAQTLPREGTDHAAARAAYLGRFPDATLTFELRDFSLVALRPTSARLVAGFGRAHALSGQGLVDWLRM